MPLPPPQRQPPPPTALTTPYVPRSLMTDLNHESSNPGGGRSSVSSLKQTRKIKTRPSSTTAAAAAAAVTNTTPSLKNRFTNNDNQRNKAAFSSSSSSSSPFTASSSRLLNASSKKRLDAGTNGRSSLNLKKTTWNSTTTPTERTASSTESSSSLSLSLSKNSNIITASRQQRRRRESGLTPPLTCRKPLKRGRDSTGSIVHVATEWTSNQDRKEEEEGIKQEEDRKEEDDVFDLKLLDSILDGNSSLEDDEEEDLSSHPTTNASSNASLSQHDSGIPSPLVVPCSTDKSSRRGDSYSFSSSIKSHLMMHCDFSSLISDDTEHDDDGDGNGEDDTMTTESGNSWGGIMMKLVGTQIHGTNAAKCGIQSPQECKGEDEEEGTCSVGSWCRPDSGGGGGGLRHLDLLLTPDIMMMSSHNNDENDDDDDGNEEDDDLSSKQPWDGPHMGLAKDFDRTKDLALNVKQNGGKDTVDEQHCHDTPKRQQTRKKSLSDTEAMHFVSYHKLQDILASGGEKALDAALDALMEERMMDSSDASDSKSNHHDGGGLLGVRSFHSSFVQNGSSLDNLYLRSSLKSALIALGSVKAERSDLESNFAKLQGYCQELKNTYEEKLKQVMIGNGHDEVANTDAVAVAVVNSNEEKQDREETKVKLQQAHRELEMQRIQLETLQKDLQQSTLERNEVTTLQDRLNELETKLEVKSKESHKLSRLVDDLRSNLQSKEQEEVHLKNNLKESHEKCSMLESRLSDLQQEMQHSEQHSFEKIRLLEEQLHKNRLVQSETNSVMHRLENMCDQLNSVQHELEKSNEINVALKQELSSYEKQNEVICNQLDDFQICCNTPMEDRIKFLIEHLMSSKEQIQNKENLLQDVSNKLSDSLQTNKTLDSEIKQLTLELDDRNFNLQKWIDLNASLADENKEMRDRIDSINGECAVKSLQQTEKIKELESNLTEANGKISCISDELRARDSIISVLQNEIDDTKQELTSRSLQSEELKGDIEGITKALQEANEKVLRLEEEVVTKNVILKEIRSSSEGEIEDLKMKLLETESKLTSMEDRHKSDEIELNEKSCIIDNLSLELEALKASSASEVNQFVEDIREIQLLKKGVEDDLRVKDAEIKELQRNIERVMLSVHSKENEIEVLQSYLNEANSELSSLREKLDIYLKQGGPEMDNQPITLSEYMHANSKEETVPIADTNTASTKIVVDKEEINWHFHDLQETKNIVEALNQELREKDELITLLKNTIGDLKVNLDSSENIDECMTTMQDTQAQNKNRGGRELQEEKATVKNIEQSIEENGLPDERLCQSEAILNEIKRESIETQGMNAVADQLRTEIVALKDTIDCKEVEIDNLRRDLALSQLEFLNSQKGKTNCMHGDSFTTDTVGEILDATQSKESDTKEDKLAAAIAEKNAALSDLKEAQNEMKRMMDICNQRELEACALEASLDKALTMANRNDKDQIMNDKMRKVIHELLHEIAHFKDNMSDPMPCKLCSENCAELSAVSRELVTLKQEFAHQTRRAEVAEDSLLQYRKEYEQVDLKLENLSLYFYDIMRRSKIDTPKIHQESEPMSNKLSLLMHQFEFLLNTWKEKFSKASTGTLSYLSATESESNENLILDPNPDCSTGVHAGSKPFAVVLNDMITHSDEVIQNVLNEFSSDCSIASEIEVNNLATSKDHMVEYSVFESLRLKYDTLVEEREELISETFALIDSSKAANVAELEAIKGRIETEANVKFITYMQEAVGRINYLEQRLASCTCSS